MVQGSPAPHRPKRQTRRRQPRRPAGWRLHTLSRSEPSGVQAKSALAASSPRCCHTSRLMLLCHSGCLLVTLCRTLCCGSSRQGFGGADRTGLELGSVCSEVMEATTGRNIVLNSGPGRPFVPGPVSRGGAAATRMRQCMQAACAPDMFRCGSGHASHRPAIPYGE